MAAQRYKISLRVLKNIYYVAIATVIFSPVKISRFRAKAHLVFHWCLYNTGLEINFFVREPAGD